MFEAFIDKSYDEDMKKIKHFTNHPELLPFVGVHYKDYGIVLIGESHYVDVRNVFTNWYNESAYETWTNASERLSPDDFIAWFNTREIVNNFLCGKRTKAHNIFLRPAEIIRERFPDCCSSVSSAFSLVAFFNYYQRPSTVPGGTFDFMKEKEIAVDEKEYAAKIADNIFDVLEPKKIIFLSKKSFDAYCLSHKKDETSMADSKIYYVNHPNNAPWNDANGKERFISLIESTDRPKCGKIENGTVIELFAEKLCRTLKNRGYKKVALIDSGADSFKHFSDSSSKCKELKIVSIGEKYTICVEDRVYIRYGKGNEDWKYLPDGGNDSNTTASPDFRHPLKCNEPFSFPCDDISLTDLVEKSVEKIEEIIINGGKD